LERVRYIIDGKAFSSVEEFARHFSATVLRDHTWRGNLNAFNDTLRGGFGTPEDGFVLVWRDHVTSRERLGPEFDTLVEIIRDHGPGGDESEDGVELVLA
jgi:RNAse (barnase) inhibitor barstar